MKRIFYNAIQTPDGTILESTYTHDYKIHIDKNGEEYMVDGGLEYLRRNANIEPYIELSVDSSSPFEDIRKHFKRGTFDKNRNRIWIPICDMSIGHLENCIKFNEDKGYIKCFANDMYRKEIEYREAHDEK
jgi:hypothetical protein